MIAAATVTLLMILQILFFQVFGVLHGKTNDELNQLLKEYEIIHPSVVSPTGEFISSNVKDVLFQSHLHVLRRQRRSLEKQVLKSTSDGIAELNLNTTFDMRNDMYLDGSHRQTISERIGQTDRTENPETNSDHDFSFELPSNRYFHFNVSAFGSELHLQVELKSKLIAPGAKSIRFLSNGERIERDLFERCYFHGKISDQSHSKVAISNCRGLAGLIKTNDDDLFIEPLEDPFEDGTPQRHVVYRREKSSPKQETSGNAKESRNRKRRSSKSRDHQETLSESLDEVVENQGGSPLKSKRHAKRKELNIETLLTADYEVVEFHGQDHVDNYLLTLINIVDEIYHDNSLGEHVNIILSGLYQLDEPRTNELILRNNPTLTLQNVCQWAYETHRNNPPEHGRAPDNSVFLTRKRFGPAGYAHVAGMCQPERSCSINFEDGFSSSFVVAHETGHVLGMEHDGEGNNCGDETSMGSIMAPLVQAAFHRYHWSHCSQRELEMNLRQFSCLRDDPHAQNWGPTPIYPGVKYSADDQCRFDFGSGYRRCTAFGTNNICEILWCSHNDNPLFCKTKKGPPVDGTSCGEDKWCFKSRCVWRDERYQPVDGNWSDWSDFGDCSRSCGIGTKRRRRTCTNPAPSHGGDHCEGISEDYRLCNRQPCPKNKDFRAEQCADRNNEIVYENQRHKWLPYEPFNPDLKCELHCVSRKTDDVVTMGEYVADGTQCSYNDPHGICIRGNCVSIGCDKIVGSNLREDACGLCGGDGNECRNFNGRINKKTGKKLNGFIKMLKIPAKARHITIREISTNNNNNLNLLAIKSKAERRYVLNSKSKVVQENEVPHFYVNAGALWTYDRRNDIESITSKGPTNSDIYIAILSRNRNSRMSINYNYTMHQSDVTRPRDVYRYEIRRWSSCSVTCGTGIRRGRYGCRRQRKKKWVGKKYCRGKPPRVKREPCTIECASARWHTGEWGECSKSCGVDGIQIRNITCRRLVQESVIVTEKENRCRGIPKPDTRQKCQTSACPTQWRFGLWTKCSATCGEGIRRRQVICRGRRRRENAEECSDDKKPPESEVCQIQPCVVQQQIVLERTTATVTTTRTTSTASTTRTSTSVATTTAAYISARSSRTKDSSCYKDASVLCNPQTLAQYCVITSFQRLCCKSCKRYLQPYSNNRPLQSTGEKQLQARRPSSSNTNA